MQTPSFDGPPFVTFTFTSKEENGKTVATLGPAYDEKLDSLIKEPLVEVGDTYLEAVDGLRSRVAAALGVERVALRRVAR